MAFGTKKEKISVTDDFTVLKWWYLPLKFAALIAGGLCYAAALAPLNFYVLALPAVALLLYGLEKTCGAKAFLCGWLWGLAWTLPSYWFLREIELPVPFFVAAAVSLFCGVFAFFYTAVRNTLLFPLKIFCSPWREKCSYLAALPLTRQIFFCIGTAVLYTFIEWSRSRIFPWNNLSATQYRNLYFIQAASLIGGAGLTFCIVFAGSSVYAAWRFGKGFKVLSVAAVLLLSLMLFGVWHLHFKSGEVQTQKISMLLIQGDLSQRRDPKPGAAEEALYVYTLLTRQAVAAYPGADLVVWPECAVPIPFCSAVDLRQKYPNSLIGVYQNVVRNFKVPILIGALDFASGFDGTWDYSKTNSALLFDRQGNLAGRYDKCHRVPFGEYVPFRDYLPSKLVKILDMGRDLVPGISHRPLRLANGVQAGMMICFESVFDYIACKNAKRGADFLLVLSNDAWYPTSSEPEQHLANAVIRAVESGLPMVRCGNNGGSLVVTEKGEITQILEVPGKASRPEIRRGRGFRKVELHLPEMNELTFYCRFGRFVIAAIVFMSVWSVVLTLRKGYLREKSLTELLEE